MIVLYGVVTVHCTALHSTTESKDNIVKDKVIESAKLRKMFMPSVDTGVQQQSRGTFGQGGGPPGPGQLLTPHGGNAPLAPPHSKSPHAQQQGTVLAAFVAKIEQLVHGCVFICSLETLEGMWW